MSVATGPSGPVTDRGRRTRERIVAAARGVFEERGFNDTRMSDIATASGVSHGTVYVYFQSKEAVLAEVVNEVLAEAARHLRVSDIADLRQRVAQANLRYLQVYDRNARLLQVVEQVATTDEHFAGVLNAFRNRHVKRVAETIKRLQGDGVVSGELDPDVAAAALSAMVEGYARHATGFRVEDAHPTLTRLWLRSLGLHVEGEDA